MNKGGRRIFNVNKKEEIYEILKFNKNSDGSKDIIRGCQLKRVYFDI